MEKVKVMRYGKLEGRQQNKATNSSPSEIKKETY